MQWRDPEGSVIEEVPKAGDRRAQLAAQAKAAEEAKRVAAMAELGEGEEPPFELERIPSKTPILQPLNPTAEINMLVHHSEIVSFIRKYVIDKVKATWPTQFKELKDNNSILGSLEKKSKVLDERFEEFVNEKLSFGRGQMFEDERIKIIFNTFLRENDPLVDEDVLESLFPKEEAPLDQPV